MSMQGKGKAMKCCMTAFPGWQA